MPEPVTMILLGAGALLGLKAAKDRGLLSTAGGGAAQGAPPASESAPPPPAGAGGDSWQMARDALAQGDLVTAATGALEGVLNFAGREAAAERSSLARAAWPEYDEFLYRNRQQLHDMVRYGMSISDVYQWMDVNMPLPQPVVSLLRDKGGRAYGYKPSTLFPVAGRGEYFIIAKIPRHPRWVNDLLLKAEASRPVG